MLVEDEINRPFKYRARDTGLTVLRMGAAAMLMLTHGAQKLIDFESMHASFPDPIGIGSEQGLMLVIGAEVGCAILLILGFLTRIAAIPLLITMGVAIYMHLSNGDPFSTVELPLLYGIVFLALLFAGPGAPSVDRKLARGVGAIRNKGSESEAIGTAAAIPVPPPEEAFVMPDGDDPLSMDDFE